LLDATFLLARLPDVVCVFKPAMLRNPFLAPAALMAGHVACATGPEFIRRTVEKVTTGRTLLIFPEGTRTSAHLALNPCKTGFALIAERAEVPVQIVVIRASRDLLPRGRRWWHVPHFPSTVDIYADDRLEPEAHRSARATAAFVEERLTEQLTGSPCPVAT
jgi:1-acyl-sn-glycerol-3-phosphate acyltransferase